MEDPNKRQLTKAECIWFKIKMTIVMIVVISTPCFYVASQAAGLGAFFFGLIGIGAPAFTLLVLPNEHPDKET